MNEQDMPTSVESATAQPGKGFGGQQPQPSAAPEQTDPYASQKQIVLDGARRVVNELMRGIRADAIGLPQQKPQQQTIGDMMRGVISGSAANAPQPQVPAPAAPAPAPAAPVQTAPQFTVARSVLGKSNVNGYDYGGYRVELPEGIDMNDGQSVQESVSFGNQMADWMNEDEED